MRKLNSYMKTITIDNLAESTTEEVFEYIRNHLLTQNSRSADIDGTCVYKNEQGLKCAAGCLIPDEKYHPKIEGTKWCKLVGIGYVPKAHVKLIQEMQYIHDDNDPITWEHHLDNLECNLHKYM